MSKKKHSLIVDEVAKLDTSFIDNFLKEVNEKRIKIIDDFLKVYVVSRLDWFKEKPERLSRLELVEERYFDSANAKIIVTHRFRVRRGRRKK